jgi:hypothetical protein
MTPEEYAEAVDLITRTIGRMGGDRPDDVHINAQDVWDAVIEMWEFNEDQIMDKVIDG